MSAVHATETVFPAGRATGTASAGPRYAIGQEVRLSAETTLHAIHGGVAQAGVVRERHLAPDGVHEYGVHFPGQAGTVLATGSDLRPLRPPFPVIGTSHGPVSSLAKAEAELISVSARLQDQASRGRMPDKADFADHAALAAGLARVCRLTPAELLGQLQPQIKAKIRRGQRGKSPAAPAAAGNAQPSGGVPAAGQPGRRSRRR